MHWTTERLPSWVSYRPIDLSAAFDTVDHDLLLKRLKVSFGIVGPVLEWFRSFLIDQTDCAYKLYPSKM